MLDDFVHFNIRSLLMGANNCLMGAVIVRMEGRIQRKIVSLILKLHFKDITSFLKRSFSSLKGFREHRVTVSTDTAMKTPGRQQ